MPIFLAVRITRQAISPRLAMRIFSNGGCHSKGRVTRTLFPWSAYLVRERRFHHARVRLGRAQEAGKVLGCARSSLSLFVYRWRVQYTTAPPPPPPPPPPQTTPPQQTKVCSPYRETKHLYTPEIQKVATFFFFPPADRHRFQCLLPILTLFQKRKGEKHTMLAQRLLRASTVASRATAAGFVVPFFFIRTFA